MDVDDAARHLGAEFRRQDAHVAGQHHEVDAELADQVEQAALGPLPGQRVTSGRHVLERYPVRRRQRRQVGMVAHDQGHVDAQRLGRAPVQQVVQAVPGLGHHDQHARLDGGVVQLPLHAELGGHRREAAAQ